jgi:ATP-dependent helicase HrpB
MLRLPIDPAIPRIQEHLRRRGSLLVQAPPGSGKTTRVPPALLDVLPGQVWVLEPRRLAARLAARRVAFERGEPLGQSVGYQVRFEEVAGPRTRLRFMTEGVLTRRLLSDPQLPHVSAVVLDEFHERHLEGDLALALLRRLQQDHRGDLRLVVMSATLDAGPLVRFLGGCPVVRAGSRIFDLDIFHAPYSGKPLEKQVASALATLYDGSPPGDVLVFLPGAAEIRRAARACAALAQRAGLLLLPLHGDLPAEEQDRAVAPADRPKVILSTNVAESSITIEGIGAVIDSGLARVASDSPWTGLPRLQVSRISRASAAQRAGRAGRTGPGRVVRLYSAEDFACRPERDTPEITRRELSQTLLELKAMEAEDLEWLEAPPAPAVEAAEELLRRLGAIDAAGRLTETGLQMAALPLHPRLARLVIEARRRKAGEAGCAVAALLSAGERLESGCPARPGPSDLLLLLESDWSPAARRIFEQILTSLPQPSGGRRMNAFSEQQLLVSVLAAFPDRVARRRAPSEPEFALASGRSAVLDASSAVRGEWIVAVDIEDRPDRGLPAIRVASGIEPEWLLDLFPERVTETHAVEWNRAAERVEAIGALVYDGLAIEQTRSGAVDPEEAARLLTQKAWEAGYARFADPDEVTALLDRVAFAARHSPIRPLDEEDVRAALASLCSGLRSFGELAAAAGRGGLRRALEERLGDSRRLLEQVAPERVRLAGGRQASVNYPPGHPPWIASRLQDFFGMREAPRVAGGVPLVVHLLAPNQRPVQITSDLAGFWERHYPRVRRELHRRYPRHRWPENPEGSKQ